MRCVLFRFGRMELDLGVEKVYGLWRGMELEWSGIVGKIAGTDLGLLRWLGSEPNLYERPLLHYDLLHGEFYLFSYFNTIPIREGQQGTVTFRVGEPGTFVFDDGQLRRDIGQGECEMHFQVRTTEPPKDAGIDPCDPEGRNHWLYQFRVQLWKKKDPLDLLPGERVLYTEPVFPDNVIRATPSRPSGQGP